MPRGERYIVGGTLGLYTTASDAINRRNKASDLKDNWNSVEGDGTPYINNFSGWQNYHPAVPIWWIPSWGGGGYEIGWVNNDDNYQATQPSVTPYTTTLGSTMTINLPRNHPDITHVVEYSFYGQTGTISSSAGTSATWTPPLSIASKIPNSTSGTGTITAKTYGGGRLVGTKTCSFAVAVPGSVVPTISHTIAEATAGLAAKISAYVQSKSKLKVTNTAAGAYGSTIKSIVTEVEKKTYSGDTITTSALGGSDSVVVKTTVTDSRGRTAVRSTTVSVLAYTAPRILRFSAWRVNSAGNALDDGTFARVSLKFSITSLGSKNDKTWKVEYRQIGSSSWVQLDSGSVYDYDSAFNSISAILSTESSYELRLTISDYFTSVATSTTVGTAYTLLDFNASGKGLAIGKVSEKNAFEVDIPAEFTKTLNGKTIYAENYHIDSTVYTAALQNGWTGTLNYEENGLGLASIYGVVKVGTAGNGTVIATLPEKFKPISHTAFSCYDRTAARLKTSLFIASNGEITVRPLSTETSTTGNDLEFNVTYMLKK